MRRTVLALVACLICLTCKAFDIEGFTTNMTKQETLTAAEKLYKLSTIDDNTVIANAPDGSYLSFNFCEGKLVAMQQGFNANLKQVTLLISTFKAKYGNPYSTNAGTRARSTGTIYEWGTWWNAGLEFVSLYYMGTEETESLST